MLSGGSGYAVCGPMVDAVFSHVMVEDMSIPMLNTHHVLIRRELHPTLLAPVRTTKEEATLTPTLHKAYRLTAKQMWVNGGGLPTA